MKFKTTTRLKICGITNVVDALNAVHAGADALGLVFYGASPRNVDMKTAAEIADALPPYVSLVGLFVNATIDEIKQVLQHVQLNIIQFHGDETPQYCEQVSSQINLPYYKAIRVKNDTNLLQYESVFKSAKALLLDTFSEQAYGGTGHTFDWNLIPKNLTKPVILAGGLNAENVVQAIKQARPYAVDVSGGVEKAKGIKDADKMAIFGQAVKDC